MSRLLRYKESLDKFIRDRSCLFDDNTPIKELLYKNIENSDLILPILLMTILNNQNRKNKIIMQGYYAASSVKFISMLMSLIDNKKDVVGKYGYEEYEKLKTHLMVCSNKSLCQNLETVKNTVPQNKNPANILLNVMKMHTTNLSQDYILKECELKTTNKNAKDDTLKWYIKDNKILKDIFSTMKQVNRKSMKEYTTNRIALLTDIAFSYGWLMGCGEPKMLKKIKKIAQIFSVIYQISTDFGNIEADLLRSKNGITGNYIINYGLQNSYELFLKAKQQFIENAMILELYTSTIKEILNNLESKIDAVIEESSPDLKSTYSSMQSVGTSYI